MRDVDNLNAAEVALQALRFHEAELDQLRVSESKLFPSFRPISRFSLQIDDNGTCYITPIIKQEEAGGRLRQELQQEAIETINGLLHEDAREPVHRPGHPQTLSFAFRNTVELRSFAETLARKVTLRLQQVEPRSKASGYTR